MTEKTVKITSTHIAADGTETVIRESLVQKPEFWDDPSEQAARVKALAEKIRRQL